ncbi:recombinase family protein [Streptomyces sp. BpilaLS-43]|uniref:recombinase family protein n=1 Tax=Streptomyces sp. BpilaLS-43 TaxID=1839778 RepID=UPI00210DDBD5|nr:recombinase family protein [Streptomyces sp. BpilaLS-43]
MDRKRADHARLYPDEARVPADPYGPIAAARREYLDRIVAQIRTKGRAPRVCLYALSVDGQAPRASLGSAAAYAERQSWQVLPEQSYTDPVEATAIEGRPGWRSVREQARKGFVDGVVVVTADIVSRHLGEYKVQIDWFEEHFGFVALVVPETVKSQS